MDIKMALKELSDMQKEIKEVKKKINQLEQNEKLVDVVKSSSKFFPFTEQHYKVEGINIKDQEKKNQYIELLKKRCNRLINSQMEIANFIENIPTSRLRRIFEYRYINHFSWAKIAYKIGGNATSDSVRKEHDRYLHKK